MIFATTIQNPENEILHGLYHASDVAQILGISVKTVHKLAREKNWVVYKSHPKSMVSGWQPSVTMGIGETNAGNGANLSCSSISYPGS